MLVTIHEFAEAEINEARLYYDLLSPGLGVLFKEGDFARLISMPPNYFQDLGLVRDNVPGQGRIWPGCIFRWGPTKS